ncbi:MAG: indoleacetamide hydrolase [Bryobacterales bacterium]|nr:indoleacetamide hydrolase [Bryobacterales bacterium]
MRFPPTRRHFLTRTLISASALTISRTGWAQSNSAETKSGRLVDLTATEAVALLRSGDLSSERYTTALLEQCRKHRALNAFIWQNEEMVLEAARAADKNRTAKPLGPLHGLPILVKDNIDTVSAPTTGGTPALRNHRPRADAPVLAPLFSAGAIMLGKTNMHELALGITSNNGAFGAVHNPYNPALIPGGSSGGNGAAIAARMCASGLGTDTGGSVRIPAALCGITALRPTMGRYPGKGIVPISHTRDTAGPMARSVQDLALLDSVITGDRTPARPVALKGVRIGIPRGHFYDNLDPSLAPVIENALATLRQAGCVLVEADIPDIDKLYLSATIPTTYYETLYDTSRYLQESGEHITIQEFAARIGSPDVKTYYETLVLGAGAPTRAAYEAAMKNRPVLQAAYRNYFQSHNVAAIAFPTTVLPARPIGEDAEIDLNGKKLSTFFTYLRNTRPMTTVGIPGLSLPVGLTGAGLPVGLEFDAPHGSDRKLLSLGMSLETVFGKMPPPPY